MKKKKAAQCCLASKVTCICQKYLHESRHQHACRRRRSNGGRFITKTNEDGTIVQEEDTGEGQVYQEGMVPTQEHSAQEHAYSNVVPAPESNRVQMTPQGPEQTE